MSYRSDLIDTFQDEVEQVEEEYEDGYISASERDRFLSNLTHNLNSELEELDRSNKGQN